MSSDSDEDELLHMALKEQAHQDFNYGNSSSNLRKAQEARPFLLRRRRKAQRQSRRGRRRFRSRDAQHIQWRRGPRLLGVSFGHQLNSWVSMSLNSASSLIRSGF